MDLPENTLQGWVRDIVLTPGQEERIRQKVVESAARGRIKAAKKNREAKKERLREAQEEALPVAQRLVVGKHALHLMAAALYIGEGAKAEGAFTFGNSDPLVIKTWMSLLRTGFEIDETKFACQLAISEGMDEEALKRFWSEVTEVPLARFYASSIRKPSGKVKPDYRGVCIVHYFSLAIRRYLDALGQGVMELLEAQ
jgi:hypothetical protein